MINLSFINAVSKLYYYFDTDWVYMLCFCTLYDTNMMITIHNSTIDYQLLVAVAVAVVTITVLGSSISAVTG